MGASVEVSARIAANLSRWWHHSRLFMNSVFDIRFFDRLGQPKLVDKPKPLEPPYADPHVR